MNHQPTHDWIVAKKLPLPDQQTETIIHGVVRPTQKPAHHYAVVVALGPGPFLRHGKIVIEPPCAVGDCVMVREVAGDPESIDGVEYHWFSPDEVLAVVRDEGVVS